MTTIAALIASRDARKAKTLGANVTAVLRAVWAGHETIPAVQLATGLDRHRVSRALQRLVLLGELYVAKKGGSTATRYGVAQLKPVTRLPVYMHPGHGNRRDDCRRYDECLMVFIKSHRRRDDDAHCPPDCHSFEEVPRWARLAMASQGGVSSGAACAEAMGSWE